MPISTNCINITVTIPGFSVSSNYRLYIRTVGSSSVPPTYVTPTTSPYIFENLPRADYEIGIQGTCDDGSLSSILWVWPVDPDCAKPVIVFNGLDFNIKLPSTNVMGYEWKADYNTWIFMPGMGTIDHILTMTEINTRLNNYVSLRADSLVDFQFRTKCSMGSYSYIEHYYHVAVPIALGKVALIGNLCVNNLWDGQMIRLTLGENAGDTQKLQYNDKGTILDMDSYLRQNDLDIDIEHYKVLLNGSNIIRKIDPLNAGAPLSVSLDFISKISPQGTTFPGTSPCNDSYPLRYAIVLG